MTVDRLDSGHTYRYMWSRTIVYINQLGALDSLPNPVIHVLPNDPLLQELTMYLPFFLYCCSHLLFLDTHWVIIDRFEHFNIIYIIFLRCLYNFETMLAMAKKANRLTNDKCKPKSATSYKMVVIL